MMRDVVSPEYTEHSARVQADHYREIAARFRLMPISSPWPVCGGICGGWRRSMTS
jgi:hypothetical protein